VFGVDRNRRRRRYDGRTKFVEDHLPFYSHPVSISPPLVFSNFNTPNMSLHVSSLIIIALMTNIAQGQGLVLLPPNQKIS
jgi:hypothetical protein